MKKICNLCDKEKESEEDFYMAGGGRRMGRCKECQKQYRKEWEKIHRANYLASFQRLGFGSRRGPGRPPRSEGIA